MATKRGSKTKAPKELPSQGVMTGESIGSPLIDEVEAAKYLRISRTTLIRHRQDGLVNYSRIGFRIFYTKEQLDEYIANCGTNATKEAQAG